MDLAFRLLFHWCKTIFDFLTGMSIVFLHITVHRLNNSGKPPNAILSVKLSLHFDWLFVMICQRTDAYVTSWTIFLVSLSTLYIVDSTLLCLCSEIDHNGRKQACMPRFPYHILTLVICDLLVLLNWHTATWNLLVKYTVEQNYYCMGSIIQPLAKP